MRKSGPLVGHILILASNGAKIGAFRWAVYGSTKKIKRFFFDKKCFIFAHETKHANEENQNTYSQVQQYDFERGIVMV